MVIARSFNSRLGLVAASALSLALLVACSNDDSTSPSVPLPTQAPPTVAPTTEDSLPTTTTVTTTVTPTTGSPTTASVLNPPPTITIPTTSTTASVELPPVPTLVPQVSADLLQPDELAPSNPNNGRSILPEQLPVLEAHLSAIQANTVVSSRWPIDPDAPELIGAPLTADTLARIQQSLRDRLAQHQVLDVSQGVTFRPYVVGPVTDTAVVYDCELAGHYWTNTDTGELVAPTEVWPAGPGHIVEVGLRVDMLYRDGRWLVSGSQIEPGACA